MCEAAVHEIVHVLQETACAAGFTCFCELMQYVLLTTFLDRDG
jgi:hypothetical protein